MKELKTRFEKRTKFIQSFRRGNEVLEACSYTKTFKISSHR